MKKTYSEPIIYLWRRERAFHPFPPGGFFDEDRVIRTPVGTTFAEPVIPVRLAALREAKRDLEWIYKNVLSIKKKLNP